MSSIVECIRELGYGDFTALQKEVFRKVAYENKSVLVTAPTGSGKTEAAVFPVFYRIIVDGLKPISAIYITPLRALNRDIESRIKRIASCFGLRVAVRHGDTPDAARRELAVHPPDVLITTPESFMYILVNEKLLPSVLNARYLIIDEFHEMVESKRGLLLFTVLHLLEKYHGFKPLKIALSATVSDPHGLAGLLESSGGVEVVRGEQVKRMEVKVVVPGGSVSDTLLGDERLESRLLYILRASEAYRAVLVFTNTRSLAEILGSLLKTLAGKQGRSVVIAVHHGSLSRSHREEVEAGFKKGNVNILVATSSMELGIDIGHVDFVVQYLSPRRVSRLIQRVGRSGHRLEGVSRGAVLSTGNLLHVLESLVLVDEALKGRVEREDVIPKPLDVLAYAVALTTLLNPSGVDKAGLFNKLREHPLYRNLETGEYEKLVEYMSYTRVIREENGFLKPTRKTRLYIYKTSMIPSTRDIVVTEVSSGRKIGSLNEEYVVLELRPGDIIVLAGDTWRIISFDEDEGRLYVEKAVVDSSEAIIPHWEGENIPVEATVALRVGETIDYVKRTGGLPPGLARLLEAQAGVQLDSLRELSGGSEVHVDYVEDVRTVFINVNWGSKVNSLLRDVLEHVLKREFPLVDFEAYSSPYVVIVRVKGYVYPAELLRAVKTCLVELYKYIGDEAFLRGVVRGSRAFYWRIYQVAQRFGAISPGETKVTKPMLEALADTVIGDEAFKEVTVKDYDLESALRLASLLARGEIAVHVRTYKGLAGNHMELLGYVELPLKRDVLTVDLSQYMERLLERELTLICINCGYMKHGKVRELIELGKYSCPRCGLASLSIVKGDALEEKGIVDKLRSGGVLKGVERHVKEDLAKRAVLLYRFGDQALLAFAGRGVGTSEAIRILNNASRGGNLIAEIYEREKAFLRVKKYIDKRG